MVINPYLGLIHNPGKLQESPFDTAYRPQNSTASSTVEGVLGSRASANNGITSTASFVVCSYSLKSRSHPSSVSSVIRYLLPRKQTVLPYLNLSFCRPP